MKRILIINLNWLGDVLFTTPAIKAIRKAYPDGYIACMLPSRCLPILENNPHLDEIIIFDEKATHRSILSKIKFILTLRRKKFEIVYMFHRSFTRLIIACMAGIKKRIGYRRGKTAILLTNKIPFIDRDSLHRIDYFLGLVKDSCPDINDKALEFNVMDKDSEFIKIILAERKIEKNDFVVLINPGANWLPKRWPQENFAKLADAIISDFNAKIIITGSSNDIGLADKISSLMQYRPVILAGQLTLGQLAALMKRVNLVVSADSGPLHIALAVGAKTVSIFGPTSAKLTGPYDLEKNIVLQNWKDCQIPCYDLTCSDYLCMKAVAVKDVITKIRDSKIV